MSNTPELRSHLERVTSSLQAANLLRSLNSPNVTIACLEDLHPINSVLEG